MIPTDQLIALVHSAESQTLERKVSCPKMGELRQTLCAFANSTVEGQFAVLLLGIKDDGEIVGLREAELDPIQKTVIDAGNDCYPPVLPITQTFLVDGKHLIAAVINFSKEKPHFTGHGYVRVGPTSRKASKEQHDEFVLQRLDKNRTLMGEINKSISIRWNVPVLDSSSPSGFGVVIRKAKESNTRDFKITKVDAFVLHLEDLSSSNGLAVPLELVTITYDARRHRTKLLINTFYDRA